jgi:hypothetical protein
VGNCAAASGLGAGCNELEHVAARVAAEPGDSGACGLAALIHDSHCGVSLIERSAGVEVGDGAGHRREDGRAHDCGALGRR